MNSLEWSGLENFSKNYLYGKDFSIITDYRTLLSILEEYRSNKFCNSRLPRRLDRLLLCQFKIEHLPGAKMGLVDYISRNPYQAASISKYVEEFLVATLSFIHSDAKLIQQEKSISAVQPNIFNLDNKTDTITYYSTN